uniref:Reverse transcriptase zinc-binding domain-containing protein n=1 Tax=Globisporangium ultimum (strain ATCC 200006 / CBS 805.95 / DAOM BR144) TaxID=431595 RepID=K3X7B0_GLOUD
MALHNQSIGEDEIKGFVKFSKRLRKILLPVFEDLQFRLAFRLLPVRSRFWFLQTSNPRIVYCVRDGCDAIETEKHLFFECALAARVWKHVRLLMAPFFRSPPTWATIATAKKPVIQDEWIDSEDIICDVWYTLRAVALHFLWSGRNRCLFDGRQPTPAAPALSVIFATFCTHLRFFQRRLYDEEDREALYKVLQAMKTCVVFGDFRTCHASLLHVRHF